jgi:hypothetical protein
MRLASILFLVLLTLPATASAADLSLSVENSDVQFGKPHAASGRLVEGTTPLAGQRVELQARQFPYDGDFETIDAATTDANGAFAFERKFARNMQLQAVAPVQAATSSVVRAYVFPRTSLGFKALSRGRLRFTQTLRAPKNVKLSARTYFYLARKGAKTARRVAKAKPKRVGSGRYEATATVKLPRSFGGRFRYASCFRYSEGSGLGDPRAACPKKYRF